MSSSLVASGQGSCGVVSSSCPGFWEPSIPKISPWSAGSFFCGVCGAGLSTSLASHTPGEWRGKETQHNPCPRPQQVLGSFLVPELEGPMDSMWS